MSSALPSGQDGAVRRTVLEGGESASRERCTVGLGEREMTLPEPEIEGAAMPNFRHEYRLVRGA